MHKESMECQTLIKLLTELSFGDINGNSVYYYRCCGAIRKRAGKFKMVNGHNVGPDSMKMLPKLWDFNNKSRGEYILDTSYCKHEDYVFIPYYGGMCTHAQRAEAFRKAAEARPAKPYEELLIPPPPFYNGEPPKSLNKEFWQYFDEWPSEIHAYFPFHRYFQFYKQYPEKEFTLKWSKFEFQDLPEKFSEDSFSGIFYSRFHEAMVDSLNNSKVGIRTLQSARKHVYRNAQQILQVAFTNQKNRAEFKCGEGIIWDNMREKKEGYCTIAKRIYLNIIKGCTEWKEEYQKWILVDDEWFQPDP